VAAPLLGEALPVELMNTVWADRARVHDELADPDSALEWLRAVRDRLEPHPAELSDWLAQAEPAGAREVTDSLRDLRDALRRLAAETTADPRDRAPGAIDSRATALDVLARSTAASPTWSVLAWPEGGQPVRTVRSAATAGVAAVALLAELGVELFAGPLREELRACLAPGCVLYFVRQHPRRGWCSDACGNRARVARHHQRRREA
jgi:predicted RNA-binding Zn ribbon-like protein